MRRPAPTLGEIMQAADAIEGTCAAGVLTETAYRSFCTGSDTLERMGLWDHDGQESELATLVRRELVQRAQAAALAIGSVS